MMCSPHGPSPALTRLSGRRSVEGMRIAIFGSGGVGAYFGGRLARAGHRVAFLARGAHLEALRRDGLAVESVAGDFTVRPVEVTDNPREIGPVDTVLVAVKAWHVREAGREVARP